MKVELYRKFIAVIPENAHDEAYIEDTLGLKEENDCLLLIREDEVIADSVGIPSGTKKVLKQLTTMEVDSNGLEENSKEVHE